MDSNALLDWFSAASVLTRVQQHEPIAVLSGRTEGAALRAVIEFGIVEARRCRRSFNLGGIAPSISERASYAAPLQVDAYHPQVRTSDTTRENNFSDQRTSRRGGTSNRVRSMLEFSIVQS